MAFFSIVIPTYNRAHLIEKAIQSVLDQQFENWELIVVDDGSTDNTQEVVAAFKDSRINYIYQENSERSAARNNGIRNSNGTWICFLDSDDYYLPEHLQTFSEYITNNTPGPSFIVAGGYYEKDNELVKKPVFDAKTGELPAQFILNSTSITPIAVCIHKDCFEKHRFDEVFKYSYWEDTHLWIRLALSFPFVQLPVFTSVLAEHQDRSINSTLSKIRLTDHIAMIQHLHTNYNPLISTVFSNKDFRNYIDRKYRMFLYMSRQNRQLTVPLMIWRKGMANKPSFYLITELPKIFLNKIGIGLV